MRNLGHLVKALVLASSVAVAGCQSLPQLPKSVKLPDSIPIKAGKYESTQKDVYRYSVDELTEAIRKYAKWLFKPQFSDCFNRLKFKLVKEIELGKLNYTKEDGIKTDTNHIANFHNLAPAWVHELWHDLEIRCDLVDTASFRRAYQKAPARFTRYVDSRISGHPEEPISVIDRRVWQERSAISFERLYFGNPVPPEIQKFFDDYVDLHKLPCKDYICKVDLQQFVKPIRR